MGIEPVSLLLAPAGAGKGVVGGTEYGNKDLCLADLAGIRIDDGHRRAAVIHKQLFTGTMNLPHAALLAPQPDLVAMTELGITVAIIRMALTILLPQQQFGHTFTFQFLADRRRSPVPQSGVARWLSGLETANAPGHVRCMPSGSGQASPACSARFR